MSKKYLIYLLRMLIYVSKNDYESMKYFVIVSLTEDINIIMIKSQSRNCKCFFSNSVYYV